ncbi:(ABC) transporter [Pleurotus pulmonarius]|nr:(ABC) transporter [Pleurotus pulmonarius]
MILILLPTLSQAARNTSNVGFSLPHDALLPPGRCPPCFNCLLPRFTCGQYGNCDPYDGQCKCPPGWGGIDCLVPQCDSLADGEQRRLREEGKPCDCKDGWGGINCNVCEADTACKNFPLAGGIAELLGISDDDEREEQDNGGMVCYTGGETVFQNHQMCDVTNPRYVAWAATPGDLLVHDAP